MLLRKSIETPVKLLPVEGLDKVVHILIFVFLGFLFKSAFRRISFITFFIIITLYGFITEVLQHLMALGRSMELADLCADVLGGVLGYFMSIKLLEIVKKW